MGHNVLKNEGSRQLNPRVVPPEDRAASMSGWWRVKEDLCCKEAALSSGDKVVTPVTQTNNLQKRQERLALEETGSRHLRLLVGNREIPVNGCPSLPVAILKPSFLENSLGEETQHGCFSARQSWLVATA